MDDVITAPRSPNVLGMAVACGVVKSGYIFFVVFFSGRYGVHTVFTTSASSLFNCGILL